MSARRARGALLVPVPMGNPVRFAVVWTAVFVLVSVAVLWVERSLWNGWGPALWARFTMTAVLGAPLTAGVAAYCLGELRHNGMKAWVRACGASAVRQVGPLLALVWLPAVVGYHLVLGILFVVGGPWLQPWTGAHVMPVMGAYLFLAVVLGGALGWVLPRWLAVSGAVVLFYVLYGLPAFTLAWQQGPAVDTLLLLTHPARHGDWAYTVPSVLSLTLEAVFFVALAAAVFAVWARWRRWGVLLLVAAGVATTVVWTAGPDTPIEGAAGVGCAGQAPRTCLTASYSPGLHDFASTLRTELATLPAALRPNEVWGEDAAALASPPPGAFVFSPSSGKYQPSRTVPPRKRWPQPRGCSPSQALS